MKIRKTYFIAFDYPPILAPLPSSLPPLPLPLGVLFHAIRCAAMQLSFCFVGKRICHLSAADVGNGNGEKSADSRINDGRIWALSSR